MPVCHLFSHLRVNRPIPRPETCFFNTGAGKTTLLNHLLNENHGLKVAVIQNEFGAIGIDQQLTQHSVHGDDAIFLANNGCICCTVASDLDRIMGQLLEMHFKEPLDAIVIETTGLARPSPILAAFLNPPYTDFVRIDSVLTVIDSKHIATQLGSSDNAESDQVREQITFADRLLINKTDLVSEATLAEVEAALKLINPRAELIRCERGRVPVQQLMGLRMYHLEMMMAEEQRAQHSHGHSHGHDHSHSHGEEHGRGHRREHGGGNAVERTQGHSTAITTVSFQHAGDLDHSSLLAWIGKLVVTQGDSILRMKGLIPTRDFVTGRGERKLLAYQSVQTSLQGDFLRDLGEEVVVAQVVFIGRGLDKAALEADFLACAAAAVK